MPLASFTFLYLFLPVSLAVYYLFPQRMRYGVLLGISLVFFLLGDPVSLLFLSVSATVDYGLGLLMEHFDEQNPRRQSHYGGDGRQKPAFLFRRLLFLPAAWPANTVGSCCMHPAGNRLCGGYL